MPHEDARERQVDRVAAALLFVRAFGLSPSAFRASARRAALFELRKNLKA